MVTQTDLDQLVERLGIDNVQWNKRLFDQGSFVLFGERGNKRVLCKIASLESTIKVANFRKENAVNQIIDDSKLPISKIDVLEYGEDKNFAWIVRHFFEGDSLSGFDKAKNKPAEYDVIQDEYMNIAPLLIGEVIKNIKLFHQLNVDNGGIFRKRFETDLEKLGFDNFEEVFGYFPSAQIEYYNSQKSRLLSAENQVACMGDLVPANLIFTTERRLILTDFEWCCRDNVMFDVSFFWAFLWRYPQLQSIWLASWVRSEQEKAMFRAELIRHLLSLHHSLYRNNPKPSVSLLAKRKDFMNHIWFRYLQAAGESYDALMNVK